MIRKILLISLIATLTISGNLIAMRDYDDIDLELDKKSEYVSTYKWCKRKAKELVEDKMTNALLALYLLNCPTETAGKLLLDEKLDEKSAALLIPLKKAKLAEKPVFECEALKNAALSEQEFGNNYIAEFVKNIIIKIITRPYVQKKLDSTKIYVNKKNIVTVIRKNNPPIKFFTETKDAEDKSPAWTDGYNVIISLRYGTNAVIENKMSEQALEAIIGHELGHIKFQHKFETWFLNDLNKNVKNVMDANFFNTLISAVNIAQEIQADIFGTFGDLELTEKMQKIFLNDIALNDIEIGRDHPHRHTRIKYLSEICSSIKNA